MAVKKILSTDTLETGFRAKYNETVDEIITGYEFPAAVGLQPDGYTLRLKKFGGGYIDINLQQFYYTKQQVTDLLNNAGGKFQVDKLGSNIVDGAIDVLASSIPVGKDLLAVYVNDQPPNSAIFYNPTTNSVYGFDDDIPEDAEITLKFI